jgi:hypothetical protein
MDSILTAHRPVNKPMTPDVRLHSYSAFRSRGHTVASAAGPMTAAILLTKLHSSLSDPMIINFTTLSITIASSHCCTITFLFPVAPCTSKRQSSRLFLCRPRIFVEGLA